MATQEPDAWVIEFVDNLGRCFTGIHDGPVGFVPSLCSAMLFETEQAAWDMLVNGYGPGAQANANVRPIFVGTTPGLNDEE